jgi:acyl carrier protein
MSDVAGFVIETLSSYARDAGGDVTEQTRLDALGMDSLDTLEAVMKIEDRYAVEIDPGEFSACASVADVVAIVARTVND